MWFLGNILGVWCNNIVLNIDQYPCEKSFINLVQRLYIEKLRQFNEPIQVVVSAQIYSIDGTATTL